MNYGLSQKSHTAQVPSPIPFGQLANIFCGKYFPDLEWRLHLHLQGSTTSLALGQHQKQKQQLMSGQDDKIMEEQTTIVYPNL